MLNFLLKFTLKLMALAVIRKHRPKIVAVTGSVGKTAAKEAIYQVVRRKFFVWESFGNYNNEIGVPLAILGAKSGKKSVLLWAAVFWRFLRLIIGAPYPQVLVLEMGADRKGDIAYLVEIAKPDIAVVTRVGEAHVEFFGDISGVQREKSQLVSALGQSGVAVLNCDDPRVMAMRYLRPGRSVTFGFSADAEIKAEEARIIHNTAALVPDPEKDLAAFFAIVTTDNRRLPVFLTGNLGHPRVYTALAAFAVARELHMTAEEIIPALSALKPLPSRLRPILGIKRTIVLDDTYNSSPEATAEALKVLKLLRAKRRIAVLGDMLELGPLTETSHRKVGRLVKTHGIDLLFTVGKRARFIADEARISGFAKRRIFEFDNCQEAGLSLQKQLQEGDAVLIKGSQGVRMEKIVLEVMAEPERAGELLCRQEEEWKHKP